jgi:dedicated sortase system histidine kinase
MKLRTKLVALSLLTLLLPWSGWKLLQELERFLREAHEGALLGSARTLSAALPVGFQTRLQFQPEWFLPLRSFEQRPALDGYSDEWPDARHGLDFSSEDGQLQVTLLAGSYDGRVYLLFDVNDNDVRLGPPFDTDRSAATDGMTLLARSPRGLFSFAINPEAPGPLQLRSERGDSGQLEGYWLDREQGYRLELMLPMSTTNTDISFELRDAMGGEAHRVAGTLAGQDQPGWLSLSGQWQDLADWFSHSELAPARTWLINKDGWILADSDKAPGADAGPVAQAQQTTWLQRLLYRLVAGSRTELLDEMPASPVRLDDEVARRALLGEEAVRWTQDLDTAVVWSTVAAPVILQDEVQGAIVMQSTSDGLLLVTNRALGRLLFTTLALTFGLAAGLWFFASRLSRRVRRLSSAVSRAMEDSANPEGLPLRDDHDELGELARNNQKLLRAVADYSQYLQTLAGKLSHELKTPLAITRSSLDNLSSQSLDTDSRQYLERAREGLDRQTAIVRAMSEASRLEAAIGVAEWERIDLAELVGRCARGYRDVYPGRQLYTELPDGPVMLHCAPDLLAQALDKLVDNAMTLSGENDPVSLSLRATPERFELAVRNTGSRLPDELGERLFDSLVSLREKRGSSPHLGLGLYIVRLVAAAHEGEVTASNLPDDRGVEFVISLPREIHL